MRKLLVGGNWKCNGTAAFAKDFPSKVLNNMKFDASKVEVVIAPAQLHLPIAKEHVKNNI